MNTVRLIHDFRCGYCGAEQGNPCTTARGVERTAHAVRYDFARSFVLSNPYVVQLKQDDPRFGLSAGDELLVEAYPYDAKVTVIRRISDGFDPQCNQYLRDVEFVRVAERELVNA